MESGRGSIRQALAAFAAVSFVVSACAAPPEAAVTVESDRTSTDFATLPASQAVMELPDITMRSIAASDLEAMLPGTPTIRDRSNESLVIAATLYSLTLLMSIKISLCGRLGGLSHISKAFFSSLFALVILMPWQALLPGVLVGAIYTPAELLAPAECLCMPPIVAEICFYLRFSGMWLVVTLLLISSQSRSIKWAKTILKRLGILH